MPFTPLSSRIAGLPDVLVGPLLRLVLPGEVSVFLAFKAPAKVTLEVFASESGGAGQNRKLAGTRITVPLGPGPNVKLHVVTVTAKGAAPLTPGTRYVYDVKLGPDDGDDTTEAPAGRSLFTDGAVRATGAAARQLLTYPGGPQLPSFVTPPTDVGQLRLLHASCRKPHGEGRDALAIGDDIVAASISSPDRPHQLFLGGDQIYADDVAVVLLAMLQDAALALELPPEQLPVKGGDKTGAQLRPDARAKLVEEDAGFTSGDADSHLLTFAEYALMYAFAWSDVLWPERADDLPDFKTALDTEFAEWEEDVLDSETTAERKRPRHAKTAKRIREERGHLRLYHEALPAVRRVLANTPSLMIFDDHEITDDWNLNLAWIRRTQDPAKLGDASAPTALARAVLRNGLAAYAIFQAWGNTPEQFDPDDPSAPGAALLDAVAAWDGTKNHAELPTLTECVGLPTGIGQNVATPPPAALTLTWHYRRIWPGHEVIALDTRTRRGAVDPADPGGPPALIYTPSDFDAMLRSGPAADPDRLVLLIAPAPMFGVPMHEAIARFFGVTIIRTPAVDPEHWALTPYARERALGALLSRGPAGADGIIRARVVVLSGDVHHGSAVHVRYSATKPLGQTGRVEATLVQLTSSALKNQEFKTFLIETLGFFTFDSRWTPIVGMDMPVIEVSGWENDAGDELEVGRERYDPTAPPDIPVPVTGKPALHEFTYGVPFTVPPSQPTPTMYELDEDPEWSYVVRPARGVREQRPPLPVPASGAAPTDPAGRAVQAAIVHQRYTAEVGRGQEVVGHNNIGDVTFHWGAGDDKSVTQKLWWRPEDGLAPQPRTRWVVDLANGTP